MLHSGIPWVAEGCDWGDGNVTTPRVAWGADPRSTNGPSGSSTVSTFRDEDDGLMVHVPNEKKRPRIKSAASDKAASEASIRPHCKCTCHLENYAGLQPNSAVKHVVGSRPSSVMSSVAPSDGIATSRPGSSASAFYLKGNAQDHPPPRSRPWSAPPTIQKIFLKTQLLRQQLKAQLNSSGSPNQKFRGRHARCYGQEQIHSQLYKERPSVPCEYCGELCVQYHTETVSRASSPSRDIEEYVRNKHIVKLAHRSGSALIISMRKNFQPLPKHNNVRRGVTPHFCNYIKSKELHDREPSTPSTSRPHTPHRYNATVPRATSTTSGRSSGTEGRPSSPRLDESDNDTVEHDIEVPRIKVSRKAPKRADESIHSEPLKSKSNNEAAPGSSDFKASNRHHGHDRSKCSSKSNVRLQADTKKHNAAETKENQQPKPSSEKSTTNGTSQPARSEAPKDPVTADTDSKSSRKGRRQVKKKEKKAFQRQRSAREETPDVVEDPLVQDKPSTPQPTTEDEAPILENPKPNEEEPPRPVPRAPTTKSVSTRRGSKSIISEPSIFKPNITEILEQELRERRFYNFPAMSEHRPEMTQKPISSNWTHGRLALSQQSSRFELPMDMKLLETMKPVEYLSKYCVVTSKRQWLYEKIYLKHKDTKLGGLNLKGLEKALKEALVDTITPEEVTEMIELVQITESSKIDQKLFVGIAAMTERLLYPRFLTEETQNIKDHKKEKIECADFCGLEWKFHGVHVNDSMRKLLESL